MGGCGMNAGVEDTVNLARISHTSPAATADLRDRNSNNPPESRELSFVSRSKRLCGVANAAPFYLCHLKVAIQRSNCIWSNR